MYDCYIDFSSELQYLVGKYKVGCCRPEVSELLLRLFQCLSTDTCDQFLQCMIGRARLFSFPADTFGINCCLFCLIYVDILGAGANMTIAIVRELLDLSLRKIRNVADITILQNLNCLKPRVSQFDDRVNCFC